MRYGDASVERAGKPPAESINHLWCADHVLNPRLSEIAYDIARFLEEQGHPSLPLMPTMNWRVRPYGSVTTSHTSDFSHRHAAVAAGLGAFGINALVLTPEYGPRQRFNSAITAAPLIPSPMYRGLELCDRCMLCVEGCHEECLGALKADRMVKVQIGGEEFEYCYTDKWRCSWAEQFRLSGHAGARFYGIEPDEPPPPEVSDDSPEEAERIVSEALERWDSVQRYVGVATIGACLQVCMPPHLRSS
jgi:ferredoxin